MTTVDELRPASPTGHFETDYVAARDRFRLGADLLDARLRAAGHPGVIAGHIAVPDPSGQPTSVDYVYVPASAHPDALVAIVSGTHGLEGPVGSAQQNMMLSEPGFLERFDFSKHGLFLVHALNPAGWVHDTREQPFTNVDFNRANWVTKEENPKIAAQQFENDAWDRGKSALMLDGKARGRAATAMRMIGRAVALLVRGRLKPKDLPDVMGRGQNVDARGIAYMSGGARPHEFVALREMSEQIMPAYDKVLFADIHSGIGQEFPSWSHPRPARDAWVMTSISSTKEHDANMERVFARSDNKRIRTATIAQQDYTDQGDTPEAIEELDGVRGKKNVVSVTIEHSTANVPAPGIAERVREMQGRFNGYRNGAAGEASAKAALRERFVPKSEAWRKSSIENMRTLNGQIAAFLEDE